MEQDRNHIISAGYIRNWAVDGVVECELVRNRQRMSLAPSQVAVRKKFYAGSPDAYGVRTAAAAEQARGKVETKALPILRRLEEMWPLRDAGDRAWVALWLAMTLCSSPRQRQEIPGRVSRFFSALERDAPRFAALTAGQRHELSEPDFELDSMFEDVNTVASLVGQMHWTLLSFARPVLGASDHPISNAVWTRDAKRSQGMPSMSILDSLEVRMAVSPQIALLLTWVDDDDRVGAIRARRHHAGAINRSAWEQAEQHRFWQPGTKPRGVDDRRPCGPISPELFAGYQPGNSSERLDAALAWVRRRLHQQLEGADDQSIVTAWMEQTDAGLQLVPVRHEGEQAATFSGFVL